MIKLLRNILFLILLHLGLFGFAQEQNLNNATENKIVFKVFKSEAGGLSIHDIFAAKNEFKTPDNFTEKTHPDEVYWIQLDLGNQLDAIKPHPTLYLKINTFDYGTLFYENNGALIKKPIGQFDENTTSIKIPSSKYHSEVLFKANSRYIYLKVKRIKFLEYPTNWSFSYQQHSIQNTYSWNDIKESLPIYTFLGIGFIMCVIMLVFFFYFKKIEFLFYSCFVLFQIVYLFTGELVLLDKLSLNDTFVKNWCFESNAIFLGLAYMLFAMFYLDLKKEYPFLYRCLKVLVLVHILTFIVDLFFFYFEYHIGHIHLLMAFRVFAFITTVAFLVYLLIYNKNRISTIFLFGGSSFMIGIGLYYYSNIDADYDPLLYGNNLFLVIGSTIEIMFFAFGLTYKVFMEHMERVNFQQEAILNKNRALRAQINPHFIFNSLSSIQYLVSNDHKENALKYLSKFSRLTRNILESSIETNVMLNEEIEMIRDYLELESLRFDKAFSYEINIDENLDKNMVEVPFMILQPFVENAIIHGLLPKESGTKELTINFKEENDVVICEVEDSGIGRQAASQKEHIYQKEKKSRGFEVSKQRLESLSDDTENIEIIDKVDADGKPMGTKVIIKIPL